MLYHKSLEICKICHKVVQYMVEIYIFAVVIKYSLFMLITYFHVTLSFITYDKITFYSMFG